LGKKLSKFLISKLGGKKKKKKPWVNRVFGDLKKIKICLNT
jgi:hypothetical protein